MKIQLKIELLKLDETRTQELEKLFSYRKILKAYPEKLKGILQYIKKESELIEFLIKM